MDDVGRLLFDAVNRKSRLRLVFYGLGFQSPAVPILLSGQKSTRFESFPRLLFLRVAVTGAFTTAGDCAFPDDVSRCRLWRELL